jgi:hypothetical protein
VREIFMALIRRKILIAVFLTLSIIKVFSEPETVKEEEYFITELVMYNDATGQEKLLLVQEEKTVTLYESTYQIEEWYSVENSGPELTKTLGFAMYTWYSNTSVAAGIEIKVNEKIIPYKILVNQTAWTSKKEVFKYPVNWIVFDVVFPENTAVRIRCQYKNRYQSNLNGIYVFLNEEGHEVLDLGYFKGDPRLTVNIRNNSLVKGMYETKWITNIKFNSEKLNRVMNMYEYLLKDDFSLETDLFSLEKTGHNAWRCNFTGEFTGFYGRSCILSLTRWDGQAAYCFMPDLRTNSGIGLGFLTLREVWYGHYLLTGRHMESDISLRKLASYELFFLTGKQLRIMRNIFYAQYGYIFKDKELASVFHSDDAPVHYTPNPDFNENMLTEIDRANIETIRRLERMPD